MPVARCEPHSLDTNLLKHDELVKIKIKSLPVFN